MAATEWNFGIGYLSTSVPARRYGFGYRIINEHLYFYRALVLGRRVSKSATTPMPDVGRNFMRPFLFIILILFVTSVFGQTKKTVDIPTFINYKNETDTSLWFKWKYELIKQIDLKDLQTSTDTFHFRFWSDVQALDVWTVNKDLYHATITNYAKRYDKKLIRKGIYKVDKIFSDQINLDSAKAKQIFNLIDTLSIVDIPTDEKIKGWKAGLDGEEFIIEISTPSKYEFKTYWTPRIFVDSLKEAMQIQTLVDRLNKDYKIYDYFQRLKLPAGSYERNGIQGIEIKATDQHSTGGTITDHL